MSREHWNQTGYIWAGFVLTMLIAAVTTTWVLSNAISAQNAEIVARVSASERDLRLLRDEVAELKTEQAKAEDDARTANLLQIHQMDILQATWDALKTSAASSRRR